MPYTIEVIVRGSKDDHKIESSFFDTREDAQAEMEKIREARRLYNAKQWDQAREALPDWLIVDAGLILSASVAGSG